MFLKKIPFIIGGAYITLAVHTHYVLFRDIKKISINNKNMPKIEQKRILKDHLENFVVEMDNDFNNENIYNPVVLIHRTLYQKSVLFLYYCLFKGGELYFSE
jgi:hypothetical protein